MVKNSTALNLLPDLLRVADLRESRAALRVAKLTVGDNVGLFC